MGRRLKRFLVVSLGLLLTLALIFVLAGPHLASGPFKRRILALLEEKIDGAVTLDDFSLGWLHGVSLRGLAVREPGVADPAIEVRSLDASPRLLPLLSGRYVIPDLEMEGVVVRARKDGESWNLERLLRLTGTAPEGQRPRPGTLPQTRPREELPSIAAELSLRDVTLFVDDGGGGDPRRIRVADRLTAQVRTSAPVEVRVEGLAGTTLEGSLDLFDGRTLLPAPRRSARLTWSGTSLDPRELPLGGVPLDGRLSLDAEIRLDGSRIAAHGVLSGTNVTVGLEEGSLGAEDLRTELSFEPDVGALAVTGETSLAEVVWVRGDGSCVREEAVTLRHDLLLEPDTARARVRVLELDSELARLRVDEGRVESSAEGELRVDVDLRGSVDLGRAGAIAGEAASVEGRVEIEGRVRARGRTGSVDLEYRAEELVLRGAAGGRERFGRPSGRVRLALVDRRALDVEELSLETRAASVSATGRLELRRRGLPHGSLELEMRSTLAVLRSLSGDLLPGDVEGAFEASGTIESAQDLAFDLALGGDDIRIGPDDARPKQIRATIRGTRDGETEGIECPSISLSTQGAEGTLSARIEPGRRLAVDGKLALMYETLLVHYPLLSIDGLTPGGAGSASLAATVPLDGSDAATGTTARFDARAERLALHDLLLASARVRGSVGGGVAEIEEGTATLAGGRASITGQLAFAQDPPVLFATLGAEGVSINGDSRELIARTVPIFAGVGASVASTAGGRLELTASGTDSDELLRTLRGEGEIRCQGGTVAGSPLVSDLASELDLDDDFDFQAFAAHFDVRDGAVFQQPFSIRTHSVELGLSGVVTLEGAIDATLEVKPLGKDARRFRRYARLLDLGGSIPFGIAGDLASPELVPPDPADLAGDAVDGLLQGGLEGLLERGLEELREREREKDEKRKKRKDGGRDRRDPGR